MKFKSFLFFLTGLLITGMPVLMAESPVVSNCDEDTTRTIDYSGLATPFHIELQSTVPVNEKEVKAGLLYDAVNGKIVWQKNICNTYPIASLTKMMVALLTVEDVRAGKFSWSDNVKWTREILIGRRSHQKKVSTEVSYSLRDVFKAAMIASNNECAEQMARYIGNGNLPETIERMNTRAKQLGMLSTYYGNPTGLPAPHLMFDNSSSPSDLLLLTLEMLKYNEVLEISSMGYAAIECGKCTSTIRNHNSLTIEYSGQVDGLKTGYTKRAGFCLVATSAKCDHRLVSIALGCRGPQIRNEIVRTMFDDYYTSIGLDRLGPDFGSPLAPTDNYAHINSANGSYFTIMENVKKTHVVKRGENLASIAAVFKCTPALIKSWNSKSIRNNRVVTGQRLALFIKQPKSIYIKNPVNGNESEDDKPLMTEEEKRDLDKTNESEKTTAIVKTVKEQPHVKYLYHIVEPGDTLLKIAQRYEGATVEELKTLNGISDANNLKPGTKIKVKVKA